MTSSSVSKKKPKILVTGLSGFLGKNILPFLQENFDVYAISRNPQNFTNIAGSFFGDLTLWNGHLWNSDQELENLKKIKFDIFLHMAALYDLTSSHSDCFLNNVNGTGVALKIAQTLEIPIFVQTSSVAAAINSAQMKKVQPEDLDFTRLFPDPYAESKALAEKLLLNWEFPFQMKMNLRLGVLVGNTRDGHIEKLNGPYGGIAAFHKLKKWIDKLPIPLSLPGSNSTRLPLIPVDIAAQAIKDCCLWALGKTDPNYLSLHLTPDKGLLLKELYLSILKHMKIQHRGVSLINSIPDSILVQLSKNVFDFPEQEIKYLLHFPEYNNAKTQEILGGNWCPEFSSYENKFWSGYENYLSNC